MSIIIQSLTYPDKFSCQYTRMCDQILVPKNRNVAFYRLIFSVTGRFFSLTLSKVYFKVRKNTLAILTIFRIGEGGGRQKDLLPGFHL